MLTDRGIFICSTGGSNGNDKCKILRDFTVRMDHEIYGRRRDVIVVQKDKTFCHIKDFAFPYDGRVGTKELEKIEQYQDLYMS